MFGTTDKPRLVVHRGLNSFSAQVIDDTKSSTVFSFSTMDKEFRQNGRVGGNVKAAGLFGEVFAKKAREKGITKIIFDRAGYLYHGRVKAFAEALRKGGLEF